LVVRYRDDGSPVWKSERILSLDEIGDTEFKIRTHMLGAYYSRVWEFYITDNAAISIKKIEETFS
jgi:hypothetical protein